MSPCFVLDTKVRRVVEQQSGQWTWVKDYVARGGLHAGTVSAAEGVRHVYLDHLGSTGEVSTSARHYAGYHAYFPFGEEAPRRRGFATGTAGPRASSPSLPMTS